MTAGASDSVGTGQQVKCGVRVKRKKKEKEKN